MRLRQNPRGSIQPDEFANSSTAYGFQVAAVVFFISLGFSAPLAGLTNLVFWGIGILLFALLIPRLGPFLSFHGSLQGYLGDCYGSATLRTVSSWVTVAGFVSFIIVELVFGTEIFRVFGLDSAAIALLTFVMGGFVVSYFSQAGHKTVIVTDQYQLFLAYLGLFGVLLWLIFSGVSAVPISLPLALLASAAAVVGMLFSGIPLGRQLEIDSRSLALAFRGLFWVTILLCLFAFVVRYREYSAVPAQNGASLSAVFDLFTLTGHSFWPFVSAFVLLPLIWQFGDTSNWHRLGDVKLSPDLHNDGPDDNPDIRHAVSKNDRLILWSGFRRFALQSPFTILLPLIIGLLLQASILPIDARSATLVDIFRSVCGPDISTPSTPRVSGRGGRDAVFRNSSRPAIGD